MDGHTIYDIITTLVTAFIASSGFWAVLEYRLKRRDSANEQRQLQVDLLRGLAHDRIMYLGMKYVNRGRITADEYENLFCYLYQPYKAMEGNGSADRIMTEINSLPVVASLHTNVRYIDKENNNV